VRGENCKVTCGLDVMKATTVVIDAIDESETFFKSVVLAAEEKEKEQVWYISEEIRKTKKGLN